MNKKNCQRIKDFLESVFKDKGCSWKPILLDIQIIDKHAQGLLFWKMKIKVHKDYKHLLDHIYSTAYSMCALTGEYLDPKKIKRGYLYLS